jgi:hypothetical protein
VPTPHEGSAPGVVEKITEVCRHRTTPPTLCQAAAPLDRSPRVWNTGRGPTTAIAWDGAREGCGWCIGDDGG